MEISAGSGPDPPSGAEIADWIREQIRRGRFVPEQRLVEVDIIRKTGGSKARVREALRRLEGEGLVVIQEFRGASVRSAGIEELRQIYRARAALEGITAADFVRYASEEQRARLRELQEDLERCVEERLPERFGNLNTQWHELLVEGSGNQVIASILQRLTVPIHRLLFGSFYNEDRLRTANNDHRRILEAIVAGDSEAAEAAMRTHVKDGFETLAAIESNYRI